MAPERRRLALVTGASAGIGAAFTRAYAALGYDVALVARRLDRLEAMAETLRRDFGVRAFSVAADLAEADAEKPVMAALGREGLEVDVLVNNAGFGLPRRYTDASWDQQRAFLMTLAVTPCALAYAVLPAMVSKGGGGIINVASIAGFSPGVAGNTLYPGVKSLMIKFSQALDLEYRSQGVRVTALCPGSTQTEFTERAGIKDLMKGSPGFLTQTAQEVARIGVAANAKGRVVVVSGWSNRIAVALMRGLPEPWVRSAINAGAAKYRLED
jgi:short-subunit dehydrogenase